MTNLESTFQFRPPIVVVLGHVDHGKTTLLDYLRHTSIAEKEVGGITQSIGASVVTTNEGRRITFIDTPGHVAFSKMRSRGAKVADLAILVVAASEGVKPQTKEALKHILEAKIPFIVAATKIDLPTASTKTVRSQLEKEGVIFEGRGGDVPLVPVSAKTGEGIQNLIEMILLLSELHEIKADPDSPLEAVVIEAGKGKAGPMITIVVRNGRLKVGDEVVSLSGEARVRGIFDWLQKPVKEVGPGEPCQVIGFEVLPPVGSQIWHKKEKTVTPAPPFGFGEKFPLINLMQGKFPVLFKAKNSGALEAVLASIPKEISVVYSGVGDVSESDVLLAKSLGAKIFSFEAKIPGSVAKLAETEKVLIKRFDIIYDLLEDLQELVKGEKTEILGSCQILKIFPFEDKKVAGCKVIQGKVNFKDVLILKRGEEKLGEVKIVSMKKGKVDISEARQGEECGILFTPQLDFRVGDVLLSVRR